MSPENVPVETDAGKSTDTEMVQIDKAELEGLKANQKVVSDIQEKATAAGFDNVEDYNNQLEAWAYDNVSKQPDEPQTPAAPVKPEPKTVPAADTPVAVPAQIPQTLTDDVAQAKGMATAAYMQTCHNAYVANNRAKPEAERSAYSKDDLLKVINGPRRATVQHLASQDTTFDGNVYIVADFLLSQAADSKRRKEESEKSTVALNKAEETATIDSATAPAPAPKTEETENDKAAYEIAPRDAPIE